MATEAPAFPEVVIDRKFVSNRQGKDVIAYAGLVDALHQLSGGYFAIETRLEQLPSAENGQTAVCSAQVRVFDGADPDVVRRVASGIGDANPGNVSRMVAEHLIRMAETRAKARALRDLCNVGMVAVEELGEESPQAHQDARSGAAPYRTVAVPLAPRPDAPGPETGPMERIVIAGKPYTRAEVLLTYRRRLEEAKAAGLALGEVDVVPPEQAPLASLVAKGQEIRRRLEARASAK